MGQKSITLYGCDEVNITIKSKDYYDNNYTNDSPIYIENNTPDLETPHVRKLLSISKYSEIPNDETLAELLVTDTKNMYLYRMNYDLKYDILKNNPRFAIRYTSQEKLFDTNPEKYYEMIKYVLTHSSYEIIKIEGYREWWIYLLVNSTYRGGFIEIDIRSRQEAIEKKLKVPNRIYYTEVDPKILAQTKENKDDIDGCAFLITISIFLILSLLLNCLL